MVRLLSTCRSRAIRSAKAWPEVSFASVLESETVITAIWTGLNGRVSSIFAIDRNPVGIQKHRESGDAPLVRSGRHLLVLAIIDRRGAGGHRVERGGRLAQPVLIDPVVGQNAL